MMIAAVLKTREIISRAKVPDGTIDNRDPQLWLEAPNVKMIEPRFLWLSLSLLLLLGNARASCIISNDTLSTNHVFLKFENNVWDLLHSNMVPAFRSIYLLCGDGNSPKKFDCDGSISGSFSPALPTTKCAKVFDHTVREVNNDRTCNKQTLKMYIVGFEFNGRFLEIYRNCYDTTQLAAQFSIHKVYRSFKSASRPSRGFKTEGAMTVENAGAFKNKQIYNCFEANLGPGQTYIARGECLFNRGHLTPVADFPSAELQRATFMMRNIVPQYKGVNNGNWKAVEAWVRRLLARKNYDVLKVCTGSLGVQQLKNQQTGQMIPIYLLESQIPVPKWTYKIVSHLAGDKYVVLTYNDVYETIPPDHKHICKIEKCEDNLNLNGKGFTFCCKPYEFIRDNLPHLTGVC